MERSSEHRRPLHDGCVLNVAVYGDNLLVQRVRALTNLYVLIPDFTAAIE